MPDRTERALLNHLIELVRDEELTLRHAAAQVKDPAVKSLLDDLATARARFAADLLPHAERLGGAGTATGTTLGALHRGWMTIKARVVRPDDRTMIAEAEHAEARTLATYCRTLDDMLPPTVRDLVERQQAEIRQTRDRVQALLVH